MVDFVIQNGHDGESGWKVEIGELVMKTSGGIVRFATSIRFVTRFSLFGSFRTFFSHDAPVLTYVWLLWRNRNMI